MRIRQVKPELWTDPVTARFSDAAIRLYIGLWTMADDAGYLEWDEEQIGALLYAYVAPRGRVKRINKAAGEIVESGRMTVLDCGHALIPTMPKHQRFSSSKRVITEKKKHDARMCPHLPAPSHDSPQVPETERNGMGTVGERNGKERNGSADARAGEPRDPRTIPLAYDAETHEWVHVA